MQIIKFFCYLFFLVQFYIFNSYPLLSKPKLFNLPNYENAKVIFIKVLKKKYPFPLSWDIKNITPLYRDKNLENYKKLSREEVLFAKKGKKTKMFYYKFATVFQLKENKKRKKVLTWLRCRTYQNLPCQWSVHFKKENFLAGKKKKWIKINYELFKN